MTTEPFLIAALAFLALAVTVLVGVRGKMLHDLTLIEKMAEVGVDPHGMLGWYARESFYKTFRIAYGWMGVLPVLLWTWAIALSLVTAFLIGSGAAASDHLAIAVGAGTLAVVAWVTFMAVQVSQDHNTRIFRHLLYYGVDALEPAGEEE